MTSRVGPYALLERLGEGGMAEVFVSQRDGTQQLSVLKRLHAERLEDDVSVARLQREANLASQLDHPNIGRLLDAATDEEGRFYLVYELIAGETLTSIRTRLAKHGQQVPLDVVFGIALAALDALEYAHGLHGPDGRHLELVHRDVTPNNLMVDYSGNVKLIDFGIARAKIDELKTAPGMLIGTLRYLSPEQALGERVDRRADLYALGSVMYELLTGELLVPSSDVREALQRIVEDPAPPVRARRPDAPPSLDRVLERALTKRRDQRPRSASELASALRATAALATPPIVPASRERLRDLMELHFAAELIRSNVRRGDAILRAPLEREAALETRVARVTPGGTKAYDAPPAEPPTEIATHHPAAAPPALVFRKSLPPAPVMPAPPVISAARAVPVSNNLRLSLGAILIAATLLLAAAALLPRQGNGPAETLGPSSDTEIPRAVARVGQEGRDPQRGADSQREGSQREGSQPRSPERTDGEELAKKPRKRPPDRKLSIEDPPPQQPPPVIAAQPPPRYAKIRAALARLQDEHDGALFDQTATEILTEAEHLDERDRRAVTTWIDNAQRAQSTEELNKAFQKLINADKN